MSDTRELILARLKKIAEGLNDVELAARNDLNPSETQIPAIIILEGDEEPSQTGLPEGRHRPATAPIPIVMIPEICIVVNEATATLGSTLNAFRAALIKAVTSDSELISLLGGNGAIVYRGLLSDLGIGRAMLGRMSLKFAITYVVSPSKL